MNQSEQINELTAALLVFHKAVGKVRKSAQNPFFKSSYAPLSEILSAIEGPLLDAGLTVTQWPDGNHGLTTQLAHESGQWMQATYTMTPAKDDPQGMGSAITYQRRYALGAVLSLNIDDDDDGNAASQPREYKFQGRNDRSESTLPAVEPKLPDDWRDVQIHFGKNQGKRLGDLEKDSLAWYVREWVKKDNARQGTDLLLQRALEKCKEEQSQKAESQDYVHDRPNNVPSIKDDSEIPF